MNQRLELGLSATVQALYKMQGERYDESLMRCLLFSDTVRHVNHLMDGVWPEGPEAGAIGINVALAALKSMTAIDDKNARVTYFQDALTVLHGLMGPRVLLTKVMMQCMDCKTITGVKEGNGLEDYSSTFCPACRSKRISEAPITPAQRDELMSWYAERAA